MSSLQVNSADIVTIACLVRVDTRRELVRLEQQQMLNEQHQLTYLGMDSAFNRQHQPPTKTHWGTSDPDLKNKPDRRLAFNKQSSSISITHHQPILTSPANITHWCTSTNNFEWAVSVNEEHQTCQPNGQPYCLFIMYTGPNFKKN